MNEKYRGHYTEMHEPFIRLVEAIFAGPYGNTRMTPTERIEWMQHNMPRTYMFLIAQNVKWDVISDI